MNHFRPREKAKQIENLFELVSDKLTKHNLDFKNLSFSYQRRALFYS